MACTQARISYNINGTEAKRKTEKSSQGESESIAQENEQRLQNLQGKERVRKYRPIQGE